MRSAFRADESKSTVQDPEKVTTEHSTSGQSQKNPPPLSVDLIDGNNHERQQPHWTPNDKPIPGTSKLTHNNPDEPVTTSS